MSRSYTSIAFIEPVLDAQIRYGSRTALHRREQLLSSAGPQHPAAADVPGSGAGTAPTGPDGPDRARDPLGPAEREFVAGRDGFYLATVGPGGWPYVQFRGGPPGFLTALDEHTLAWADFRGNRQYISAGNLAHDSRVSIILMDYAPAAPQDLRDRDHRRRA